MGLVGTPHRELARSAAGERVGSLAAESGLFQFHFEHRVALDLPEQWVPAHAPELAEPPPWTAGRLAERKYQSFRHDLAVGSFHPGQRGKWSAHELCHGLVGFAWHPGASPLFHATAGRLAELLPVALWYWFDEADRRRCPLHDGGGALFREYCRACDLTDGRSASDAAVIDAGRAYVRAELQAIERTLETGQVWPHRFATLDLSSDGVAYAVAHGERLRSPGFAGWMERFAVLGGGWSDSLSMLRERVEAVTAAVVDGAPLPPLAPSAEHGRWRWRVQDVAWRLQVVRSQCDGEAEARIGGILDALAAVIPTTEDGESDAATACREALAACAASYVELHEEWELLPPADLFALGHPLGVPACDALGDEGSRPHLADGLRTCAPASLAMAGGRGGDLVQGLLTRDRAQPRRDALADRWAKSLAADLGADDAIAQVARFEAATSVVPWRSRPVLDGQARDARWRLVPGVRVERFSVDAPALMDAARAGRRLEGAPAASALALVVARSPDGEALVAGVEADVAAQLAGLGAGAPLELGPDAIGELAALGVIEPVARVV